MARSLGRIPEHVTAQGYAVEAASSGNVPLVIAADQDDLPGPHRAPVEAAREAARRSLAVAR